MTTKQDIDSFAAFAAHQMRNGASDLSVEEICDLWQAQQQNFSRKAATGDSLGREPQD
jgi:hypothetical protein